MRSIQHFKKFSKKYILGTGSGLSVMNKRLYGRRHTITSATSDKDTISQIYLFDTTCIVTFATCLNLQPHTIMSLVVKRLNT